MIRLHMNYYATQYVTVLKCRILKYKFDNHILPFKTKFDIFKVHLKIEVVRRRTHTFYSLFLRKSFIETENTKKYFLLFQVQIHVTLWLIYLWHLLSKVNHIFIFYLLLWHESSKILCLLKFHVMWQNRSYVNALYFFYVWTPNLQRIKMICCTLYSCIIFYFITA